MFEAILWLHLVSGFASIYEIFFDCMQLRNCFVLHKRERERERCVSETINKSAMTSEAEVVCLFFFF